jgi:hypothetical protein
VIKLLWMMSFAALPAAMVNVIRAKWRDYIIKFTRIAAAFEESVYGASALYIGGEKPMVP